MADKKKDQTKRTDFIPDELAERGREIWLAGLGALSAAEEEGSRLFNTLIERGESYEKEGRKQIENVSKAVEEQSSEVSSQVGEVSAQVNATVSETIEAALERFGVPTQSEVQKLTDQVDDLSKKVEALAKLLENEK